MFSWGYTYITMLLIYVLAVPVLSFTGMMIVCRRGSLNTLWFWSSGHPIGSLSRCVYWSRDVCHGVSNSWFYGVGMSMGHLIFGGGGRERPSVYFQFFIPWREATVTRTVHEVYSAFSWAEAEVSVLKYS